MTKNESKMDIKCFQFYRFLNKSTLKEYEIELIFNDWVSSFFDFVKLAKNGSKLFEFKSYKY